MKKKIYLMFALIAAMFACEDETKIVDPVYEFVAFKGPSSIDVNELANSGDAYPLVIEIKAFDPYQEDIEVGLEITGNNATPGADFIVTPDQSVTIPAGSFVSDTIYIRTVDNAAGSAEARSFDIRITSINKENINIGLGLAEPKNAVVTVNILDDECSETTAIFNSNSLVNTLDWGGGPTEKPATGVLTGNDLKVTGDLIDYGAFSDATITITLIPESEGSTKGTATFGEQVAGDDSDGYEYKFIQTGEGTYDVCSGVINVAYDIYWLDGATWAYWYSVTNVYSAP